MKYIITILSNILFISFANAQNIVPNYSFEEADSCPTNFNQNNYMSSLGCVSWGQATTGNPDYYNACDTAAASIGQFTPIVGVPDNAWGHQFAYDGVAYTGVGVYEEGLPSYKEYLITEIPPLEIDTVYQVTIHLSLAVNSWFATDGMGVFFTTYGSPNQFTGGTLVESPQIDYTSYGVISDTANWTTLTGTFIADSAYTKLIIGVFKNANQMTISSVNENSKINSPKAAYYYLDAVIVEKLSSTSLAKININDGVKIYPNPFTDHTTMIFDNPNNQNYTLTIFNAQGFIVRKSTDITSNRLRIERNDLPSGFYYYQLANRDNIVANGKLIIY